jgi:DHA2 family multidrug resistance protein
MSGISSGISPGARGPLTLGLMLSTFMLNIDSTVVNVALPRMQGPLSASSEQITWVLTSFVVSLAITIPISGWLAGRFGVKTVLIVCTSLFTAVSVFCGIATNLPEMVLFRMLQGITSAPIAPLAQAVLININPPERIGRAMAMFSTAAVLGPTLGPVLGGWLTEQLSWRWCFYVNLPAGILSIILVWIFLPKQERLPREFDFLGFGALAVGLACLQLVLDRGPTQGWFDSAEIWTEALISVAGFWIYVTHTLTARNPLFDPRIARDRNFVTSAVISVFFATQLYASIALLPLMTQGVMGYPVMTAALVSMPRAIVLVLVLQIIGRLDAMMDRRILLFIGLGALVISFWQMSRFDIDMGPHTLIAGTLLLGVGQGFMSVPLTTLGLATLPAELRAEGSAITNLIRTIGASLGIAAMQALTVFNGARMHAALAAHVRLDDPVVRAGLPAALSPETVQGALQLNAEVTRQADMAAFVDDFWLMAIVTLSAAPLILLLRQNRSREPTAVAPVDAH